MLALVLGRRREPAATRTPASCRTDPRDGGRARLRRANKPFYCTLKRRRRAPIAISIKPLEDRIVVQTVEAEQTTASGLVIPDTAKEKPQEGKVVAVGPGRVDDSGKRVPVDVAEGDVVIYSKYGGTEVSYAGEDYLILSARDVLAVVTK